MASKVRWIHITTDMFDDEKIKIIESMPDADALLVIWVKMICQAGKQNAEGWIYMAEDLPYSPEELALVFSRPVNTVKLALATFERLRMIEINGDRGVFLINFAKNQNIEGLAKIREGNKLRKRREREKRKLLPEAVTHDITGRHATDKIRIDKNILEDKLINLIKNSVNTSNFNAYFKGLKIIDFENSNIVIGVPSNYAAEQIENTGMDMLRRLLFSLACDYEPKIVLLEGQDK